MISGVSNKTEKGVRLNATRGPGFPGGLFFIMWILFMIGGIIGYIILLVALWRGMKAHESMASALREIGYNLKSKS